MTPLKRVMQKAGATTYDGLARDLREASSELEWAAPRSLGAKLSALGNGEIDWWLKRPEHTQALAALLECEPEDLGLHLSAPHHFGFDDFPELPPLDLQREAPCNLGYFTLNGKDASDKIQPWFGLTQLYGNVLTFEPGIHWLHLPSGAGRDLFWRYLQARSPYPCLEAATVANAVDRLAYPEPFCLRVDDSGGERDLVALTQRHQEGAILICAPFPLPESEAPLKIDFSWQSLEYLLKAKPLHGLRHAEESPWSASVYRYDWQLHANWQVTLLTWMADRLSRHKDSLFDPAQLGNWLDRFSDQGLFDTPASLIAIGRLAHHHPVRRLPSPEDRAAGQKLLELLNPQYAHCHAHLAQLVRRLLLELDLPWNAWLDARKWRTLAASPTSGGSANDAEVQVESPTNLVETPFIAENERGQKKFAPHFLVQLLARDHLHDLISTQPHTQWGTLCFDPARCKLVLQALRLLSLEELDNVAAGILDNSHEDAASFGAAEAVFLTIGLREPDEMSLPSNLAALGHSVLLRLAQTDDSQPVSWLLQEQDTAWWVGICWTWSLLIPKPSIALELCWHSFFPGWADQSHPTHWRGIPCPEEDCQPLTLLPASERYLLHRAALIAARLAVLPSDPAELLIPHLLADSVAKGWDVPADWWQLVVKKTWAADLLLQRLDLYTELTPWLLSLLESLSRHNESETPKEKSKLDTMGWFMMPVRFQLRYTLFSRTTPDSLLDSLSIEAFRKLVSYFTFLSPEYQRALLHRLRYHPMGRASWYQIVDWLNVELVDAVEEWLDLPGYEGLSTATWMWGNCPERAEELLGSQASSDIRSQLVRSLPFNRKLDTALDVLEQDRQLLPEYEQREWLLRRLPGSGSQAPRLLALLFKP